MSPPAVKKSVPKAGTSGASRTARKPSPAKAKAAAKKPAPTRKASGGKAGKSAPAARSGPPISRDDLLARFGGAREVPHPSPRYVIWECTREYDDENLFGRPHQAPPGGGKQLDTDQACALIDTVARFGSTILIIGGGEPLLRKDIFELARYAKTKGLKVILSTQGHLFDANAARECVMAGIKAIQVGLDGSSSRSHDGFRGSPGSFVKAIKGIELMRLAGLRFEVNSFIDKENVEEIPKIQSLAQKLGARGHNVSFVIPTGRFAAFKGRELSGDEYDQWLNRLFEQKYRQKMNMKLIAQPQFHRIIYHRGDELSDAQDPNRSPEAAEALGPPCPAGRLQCYVSADGEVFPTPHLIMSVGNVGKSDLRKLWQEAALFNYLRSASHAACQDPKSLASMMGGCGCMVLDELGRLPGSG